MRNYLLVDGNYFGHRMLHGMRSKNKEFVLKSIQEQSNFLASLNNGLLSFYSSFNNEHYNLIDNIIFVFDNESWRKQIPSFRPYYIDEIETENIDYKANRIDIKEESDVDWDNFDIVMDKFHKGIEDVIVSFKTPGCEGDDGITLLTDKLKDEDITFWVFCTDGDLKQTVTNKVFLFRNIRSGECPDGEFVLSPGIFNKMFGERTPLQRMTDSSSSLLDAHRSLMFKVALNGGTYRGNISRTPGKGIAVADPVLTALTKTICGDKKDNVYPIYRWIKGSKNYKVTEKMIEKVWKGLDMDFSEQSAVKTVNDKGLLVALLLGLKAQCKIDVINMKSVGDHFKHNMKIIFLQLDFIPDYVKGNFDNHFNTVKDRIYKSISREEILSINLHKEITDNATDLLVSSVPSPNSLNTDTIKSTHNALIDEIFNS